MRILIADDDKATRTLLARVLASEGHEVEACESAESALARLESGTWDVLLTDVVMEAMSGLELVAKARSIGCPTRCFVMSGVTTSTEELAGAAFLQKPLDLDAVLAAIVSP